MTRSATKTIAKPAEIAATATLVAERLRSTEAKIRLTAAAAAARVRSRAIVSSAAVDPRFLAKRVTF
jgi:hypothetical protein